MSGLTLSRRSGLGGSATAGPVYGPGGTVPMDALWLKANALTLADADPVSSWTDLSGVGNNATSAGTARPTYRTNVVNSLAAVQFDGSSDVLDLPNLMSSAAAGTALVVCKADADPNSSPAIGAPLMKWGSANDITFYPYVNGMIFDDFGTTERKTTVDPTPSLAGWHIYEVISAAGEWTSYINGTQIFTTATNSVGWRTAPNIGGSTADGFYFGGYIAEIVVCKSALSAGDRSSIRSAMGTKYAITVV